MCGAERSLENLLTLIADQGTASFKVFDCGEKIIEMTEGQRALRLIEKNEGFAEQGQKDVDLNYGLDIGVVEAALDRRCGGGDDDHESSGGGTDPLHDVGRQRPDVEGTGPPAGGGGVHAQEATLRPPPRQPSPSLAAQS